MPVRIDPSNPREIVLSLPVRYQSNDIINAIPELEAYLKGRYPEVKQIHVPKPPLPPPNMMLQLSSWEVLILIGLWNNPFTTKIAQDIADDAYKWIKRRFKIKKRPRKRKRRTRG